MLFFVYLVVQSYFDDDSKSSVKPWCKNRRWSKRNQPDHQWNYYTGGYDYWFFILGHNFINKYVPTMIHTSFNFTVFWCVSLDLFFRPTQSLKLIGVNRFVFMYYLVFTIVYYIILFIILFSRNFTYLNQQTNAPVCSKWIFKCNRQMVQNTWFLQQHKYCQPWK